MDEIKPDPADHARVRGWDFLPHFFILLGLALMSLLAGSCSTDSGDDVYTVTFKLDSTRVGKFDSVMVQIYNGPAPGPGDTLTPVQVTIVKVGATAKQVTVELNPKVKKDFSVVITGYSGKDIAYRGLHSIDGFKAPDSTATTVLLITRIQAEDLNLRVGETLAPKLSFTPANAGDKRIVLASRDSSVVRAAQDSLYGIRSGTAKVAASTPDGVVTVEFTVTVSERVFHVEGIAAEDLRALVGDTLDPKLTWQPANAGDKTFFLRSLDPAKLELTGDRMLAKALGKAKVEVVTSEGAFADTFTVSVENAEFKLDVLPITSLKCAPCHVPGTNLNFQDSLTVLLNGSKVLDRLGRPVGDPGKMPVAGAPNGDLGPRQLGTLLEWLHARVVPLISVAVANDTVKLGKAKDPAITWNPAAASNKSFTMLSLDSSKVEVSGTQIVGKALGQAQVQLRTLEGEKLVTFNVTVIPIAVDSISILDTTASIGDTLVPVIRFHPSDATTQTYSLVKFRPASTATTVLPGKRIVANALGKDTLVATSSDGGKVSMFTVTVGPVHAKSLSIPDTNGTANGPMVKPRLKWTPANTTDTTYELSIDPADTAIAAVRALGTQIQGKAIGSITITATSKAQPSIQATFKFTVGPVLVIGLSAAPVTTYPGLLLNPVLTWNPNNATNQTYTLTSGDTAKVKIQGNQAATKKLGTAVVTVTSVDGSKTAAWNLTIIRTPFKPIVGDLIVRPQTVIVNSCGACHNSSDAGTNWQDSATAVLNRAEMLRRTGLPLADPDHMPPSASPQPTAPNLDVLRNWLLQE